MPWNTGDHLRKFLRSPGSAIDGEGRSVDGDLVFWGEWESESRYTTLAGRPNPGYPRYLHEPFWREPVGKVFRQNTDPYVFGDSFRYSNCKQLHGGRPSGMQRLDRGSVLLFGGSKDGAFLLDTVIVIAKATPWSVHATQEVADPTLRRVTCDSVATVPGITADFTLYDGATAQERVDGMFSFTPCLPFDDGGLGFAKPAIRLEGIVNPLSYQAPKRTAVSAAAARDAWLAVRDQVLEQGLLLGSRFASPQCEV